MNYFLSLSLFIFFNKKPFCLFRYSTIYVLFSSCVNRVLLTFCNSLTIKVLVQYILMIMSESVLKVMYNNREFSKR